MRLHRHDWFNYSIRPVMELETGGGRSPFKVYVMLCLKCREAKLKVEAKK